MEKKEFAVGEEFQMGLVRLRCEEYKGILPTPCYACIGYRHGNDECGIHDYTGKCWADDRADGKDVYFVEVK